METQDWFESVANSVAESVGAIQDGANKLLEESSKLDILNFDGMAMQQQQGAATSIGRRLGDDQDEDEDEDDFGFDPDNPYSSFKNSSSSTTAAFVTSVAATAASSSSSSSHSAQTSKRRNTSTSSFDDDDDDDDDDGGEAEGRDKLEREPSNDLIANNEAGEDGWDWDTPIKARPQPITKPRPRTLAVKEEEVEDHSSREAIRVEGRRDTQSLSGVRFDGGTEGSSDDFGVVDVEGGGYTTTRPQGREKKSFKAKKSKQQSAEGGLVFPRPYISDISGAREELQLSSESRDGSDGSTQPAKGRRKYKYSHTRAPEPGPAPAPAPAKSKEFSLIGLFDMEDQSFGGLFSDPQQQQQQPQQHAQLAPVQNGGSEGTVAADGYDEEEAQAGSTEPDSYFSAAQSVLPPPQAHAQAEDSIFGIPQRLVAGLGLQAPTFTFFDDVDDDVDLADDPILQQVARNRENPRAAEARLSLSSLVSPVRATGMYSMYGFSSASPYDVKASLWNPREEGEEEKLGSADATNGIQGPGNGSGSSDMPATPTHWRYQVIAVAVLRFLWARLEILIAVLSVCLSAFLAAFCRALWELVVFLHSRLGRSGRIDPARLDASQPISTRAKVLLLIIWERTSSVTGIACLSLMLCVYGWVKFETLGY